jgi:peptidoglycan hydrolase CwlO-like protein
MKKLIIVLLAICFIKFSYSQTKELVYRVDGDIIPNSSGESFHAARYVFQSADNASVRQTVVGNFNRNNVIFFYVYTAPAVDDIIKVKDAQIATISKQVVDLQNAVAALQAEVKKLEQQSTNK